MPHSPTGRVYDSHAVISCPGHHLIHSRRHAICPVLRQFTWMLLPHIANNNCSFGSVPSLLLVLDMRLPFSRDSGPGMDTELIGNSRYPRFCEYVRGCHCRKHSGSSTIKETAPRRHIGIQCNERKRIGLALVYFIGVDRALIGTQRFAY